MKSITVYQPYASLVALGHKPHETRSWPTSYRGPLLVHAGKQWNPTLERAWVEADAALVARGLAPLQAGDMPFGAVVAIATLADCYPTRGALGLRARDELDERFGDWSAGRWAWLLEHVCPLSEPIPWRGAQGLWGVPAELEALVLAALPSPAESLS
jgi:hypothetical protein